jgi:hypothetical protein
LGVSAPRRPLYLYYPPWWWPSPTPGA